jgi:hypothetical protein
MVPVDRPKTNEKFASRKKFSSGIPALLASLDSAVLPPPRIITLSNYRVYKKKGDL